ncbi:MAG: hypothetical protein A2135_01180 [Actinobacteria bacterium RBG_16_67_15]|nr:MAG: hypothetical protein A2135_01180 [Actinobacteria bacterium RBG_16_67_15]
MLDGLFTFFASHHAIRADKTLRDAGMESALIAGPKELSPNCGTAVRFDFRERDRALALLATKHVEVDAVHPYTPRTDDWRERRPAWRRTRSR